MLGRKAVAGCVGNADGLIGADKYGQESPGPITPVPALPQLRHWIPRSVVHCECVLHMHIDSIQQISELGSGTYGRVSCTFQCLFLSNLALLDCCGLG